MCHIDLVGVCAHVHIQGSLSSRSGPLLSALKRSFHGRTPTTTSTFKKNKNNNSNNNATSQQQQPPCRATH